MFKKIVAGSLAALTIAAAAVATPAAAAPYGWHGGYYYRGGNTGAVVGAGLLGLAVGAAIAQPRPVYYAPRPVYYAPRSAYYYAPRYACGGHWRWDSYLQRDVLVRSCR